MRTRKEAHSATAEREAWVRSLRRANELQEDALGPVFDERWGEIEDGHRAFVERFLALLPPDGRVLDAACGTGKYFSMVLDSGRSLCGVDHSGAYLARARAKCPNVATEKYDLQDLPYENEFDGVMCVDAMEFVPPEDWPGILARFRRALLPQGWLYLTVELVPEAQVRALNDAARRLGHPVVEREILWDEPEGLLYHHYPAMAQVRTWLTAAGFSIEEDVEGPWHDGDHAYHHILAIARESGR
jgi:SAM-dependent methyltransferase